MLLPQNSGLESAVWWIVTAFEIALVGDVGMCFSCEGFKVNADSIYESCSPTVGSLTGA